MELLRRIAYGRLAEALGPVAVSFDHGLRLLDPRRAVPAIIAGLPDHTRDWLEGFVAGINHHIASAAIETLPQKLASKLITLINITAFVTDQLYNLVT